MLELPNFNTNKFNFSLFAVNGFHIVSKASNAGQLYCEILWNLNINEGQKQYLLNFLNTKGCIQYNDINEMTFIQLLYNGIPITFCKDLIEEQYLLMCSIKEFIANDCMDKK